jgi:metal-responsive CopG/Arc/MetJ family transcriptional regulator
MSSVKLAVSLPEELFEDVERARKRRGVSRSAVVQTGLRAWLKAQRDAERSRAYVAAYRARPESDAEVAEAAAIILASWKERAE